MSSSYTPPGLKFAVQYKPDTVAEDSVRRPCVIGGLAKLVRYTEAAEKPTGYLGVYDLAAATAYAWPDLGSDTIDASYTKLHADNALLKYFSSEVSDGFEVVSATYLNRVIASGVNFTSVADVDRDARFYTRDVAAGDYARVRCSATGLDALRKIRRVRTTDTDGTIAAGTDNAPTERTTAVVTVLQTAGADNCIGFSADATSYSGLASGYIDEVYTLEVVKASDGDLSTAEIRVTSASGTDPAQTIAVDPDNPMDIGTRGLTAEIDFEAGSCTNTASDSGVETHELYLGQKWTITVQGRYIDVDITIDDDSYTGTVDDVYTMRVIKGGAWASGPRVVFTTAKGTDSSGPITLTASGTVVNVGRKGGAIEIVSSDGLRLGDEFTFTATASVPANSDIIEFTENLPADTVGEALVVDLFIHQASLEISEFQLDSVDTMSWEQDEDNITVNADLEFYHPEWVDEDGNLYPLPLHGWSTTFSKLYVTYRAWVNEPAGSHDYVYGINDLSDMPGSLTADNPLKYAAYCTLIGEGSNSTATASVGVCYIPVANPDSLDSWLAAIDTLSGIQDVTEIVPQTNNAEVIAAFVAHVGEYSSASRLLWRKLWCGGQSVPLKPIVYATSSIPGFQIPTTSDDEQCTATITSSGGEFVLVTSSNGQFITNEVAPGDLLYIDFLPASGGTETHSTYVVDEVLSETQLLLVSGPASAISIAKKAEVWRNTTPAEEATAVLAQKPATSGLVVFQFAEDDCYIGSTKLTPQQIAALTAGQVASVVVNRPLTLLDLPGVTTPSRKSRFGTSNLNVMAGGGVWLVVQDTSRRVMFHRHALTTALTTNNVEREEVRVRATHEISYTLTDVIKPFVAATMINLNTLSSIRMAIENQLNSWQNSTFSVVGPLIARFDPVIVEQNPVNADEILINIEVYLPGIANSISVTLGVGVANLSVTTDAVTSSLLNLSVAI